MSLPIAHLTADGLSIDLPGHREHMVYEFIPGPVTYGRPGKLVAKCRCGDRFELDSKPKEKP